ncbi:MAG: glycosyltransferase [Verrucomicrobia bacterium]|nr:glycosyltransferase [Verrucomicrobiota bacterium]
MRKTTIVHVTQSVSRLAGGLFDCVRHLSQSIHSAAQAPITIMGPEDDLSAQDKACWAPLNVRTHRTFGPHRFSYAPGLARDLRAIGPDLVHLHGAWRYNSVAVWQWGRRTGRPYVVSPHGMIEPWSLRQSRLPKQIANLVYQGPCLRNAKCICATSMMEAESIRQAGYHNPIALVPNGVEFPPKPLPRSSRADGRPRRALFLSRIHPKKGLLNLVKAWRVIQPVGWELLIVGPDEAGHSAEVKASVREHGLQDRVLFPGEAWGEEKTKLYCDSDLFVLPSFSENFGLVIAEALSCEVPVITTRATPWRELEERRCGWWIETGVAPLVGALREALALPAVALHEMGLRGRILVEEKYAWGPIGQQMVEVYAWMLGRRDKPGCII